MQAFDGATVAVGNYVTEDAKTGAVVVAIRAPSPGLPISLPEQVAGLDDLSQFLTANASDPQEASSQTERYEEQRALTNEEYRRSDDSLTVFTLSGGTEGPEGRALMIETTNEAFDAVS